MRTTNGARVLSFLLFATGAAVLAGCPGEEDVSDGGADGAADGNHVVTQTTGAGGRGVDAGQTPPGTGGGALPPPTSGTGGHVGAGTGGAPLPPPGTGGHVIAGTGGAPGAQAGLDYVFVIAMENEPASAIYGSSSAPYINNELLPKYAHATGFTDPLPDGIPSEPHYVWMEAGTNKFSDVTFSDDGDPSSGNSTKSTAHLTTQMGAASPPVSWLGYMEGLNSSTGACPIRSSGVYGAKHDPFVFFQDVAGSPPSTSNAFCADHHRPYAADTFAQDLSQVKVAQYNFISPNLCHDMHGDSACPSGNVITAGDTWLSTTLPPLIAFVNAHHGVIFVVWDEPEGGSNLIPFIAIGPTVKANYTSRVAYTHSSLTKTVEEIFGLPILPTVAGANDFGDLFQQPPQAAP